MENTNATNNRRQLQANLGEMVSDVAHEINNPLAIIIGRTGILKKYLKEISEDQKKNFEKDVDSIKFSAQKISDIVEGLRVFSRFGSNNPVTKMNLEDCILKVLGLCHYRMQKYLIEVKFFNEAADQKHNNVAIVMHAVWATLLCCISSLKNSSGSKVVQINLTKKQIEVCASSELDPSELSILLADLQALSIKAAQFYDGVESKIIIDID